MIVDRCQIFDENGVVFETVVEDDAVHSHLINHVQKSEELTLGANSAHTHYAFDFNGMSRLGAKICTYFLRTFSSLVLIFSPLAVRCNNSRKYH